MAYDKEVIAGNIRAERGRMRLSRRELAEQVDIPDSTLKTYEDATSGISVAAAWALADVFGMSIDEFVGREWPMKAS